MNDYKLLKIARMIFKALGWVALALGVVTGAIVLITGGGAPTITPQGIEIPATPRAAGLIFMVMGAFYFFILFTVSEIINILLDLKLNCNKPVV